MIIENKQSESRLGTVTALLAAMILLVLAQRASAGTLVPDPEPPLFGTYAGVEFTHYTGRFTGETAKGPFNMPFEIVAPTHPQQGHRTVLMEPPHFAFGAAGRDGALGRELLFGRGFSYASVGFSDNGFNILDPFAVDATIAGQPVFFRQLPPFARDVEILKQFSEALLNDPFAISALGEIDFRYAFGASQTAEALFEVFFVTGAEDLFDLTVMQVPLWRTPLADPQTLAVLPEDFYPPEDVGKVMIVGSEGDQFISESAEFRNAVRGPEKNRDYRVYEVAGAPHLALPTPPGYVGDTPNPLEIAPVVRAVFIAGHRWVRHGWRPPRSALLKSGPAGILRDADGNARGGVRLPDVAVGRAQFVASTDVDVVFQVLGFPGFIGLGGLWFDLACEPASRSHSDKPRFRSHRHYVRKVKRQVIRLFLSGFLLPKDAIEIYEQAKDSDVGKPGSCIASP